MDIMIRGMEMPTSCRACHLKMNCDDCEGLECVCVPLHQEIGYLDDLLTDKRREDCPLVPVPKHGRLGDLDKLENNLRHMAKYQHGERQQGILGCCETIRSTPTIIQASEEGET